MLSLLTCCEEQKSKGREFSIREFSSIRFCEALSRIYYVYIFVLAYSRIFIDTICESLSRIYVYIYINVLNVLSAYSLKKLQHFLSPPEPGLPGWPFSRQNLINLAFF